MAVATSNQGLGSLFNPDNYTQARPYAGDPFGGRSKIISGPFGDMEVPFTFEGNTYGGSGSTFDAQGNVSGTMPVQPVPVTVVEDPGVSYGQGTSSSIFGPSGYQPSISVDPNQPPPGITGGMDQLPIPPLQASLSETYPSVIDPVVRDPVFPSYDTVSVPPRNPFRAPVNPVQAPPTNPFMPAPFEPYSPLQQGIGSIGQPPPKLVQRGFIDRQPEMERNPNYGPLQVVDTQIYRPINKPEFDPGKFGSIVVRD